MTAPTTLIFGTPWLAGGREGLSLLAGAAAKGKNRSLKSCLYYSEVLIHVKASLFRLKSLQTEVYLD
jgi:hypothetical protein